MENGSSRGKTKYKYKTCGRIFYDALEHRMDREQRERILKEYLNKMSMRAISRVEGKSLTTEEVYHIGPRFNQGVSVTLTMLITIIKIQMNCVVFNSIRGYSSSQ
ncbi:ORF2 in transposon ISC1173 [Saccharolobus solfataricus]|uniref:ORF2 in transposon ISC1173 n=1 Tax=Saccharolobus solfataricus TaxID=2287 RepID=A0A157T0H6_SACSO|nr:ORF2 in transposon ISC1173 [Saccharolobus solfataricus]